MQLYTVVLFSTNSIVYEFNYYTDEESYRAFVLPVVGVGPMLQPYVADLTAQGTIAFPCCMLAS